jgi:hypothetical protein
MNSIYFPLWSNVDFFEDKSKQPNLIKRIKLSILMNDELYFDSGHLTFTCSENGSFNTSGPYDGSNPLPEQPIESTFVMAKNEQTGVEFPLIPLGKGKYYSVCFEHLIKEMGLTDEDFIKFRAVNLNKEGEKLLNEIMDKTASYKDYIPAPDYCKDLVLKNFHKSIILSYDFVPIMVDNIHQNLLNRINVENMNLDLSIEILHRINKLLRFNIPDFSEMKVEDILDLRKDKLFIKFRKKLFDINSILTKNIKNLDESVIESLFFEEYINEMKKFSPSGKDVLIDGGLGIVGLFPMVGTIASVGSLAKTSYDATKVYDYKNSWTAFIMKY